MNARIRSRIGPKYWSSSSWPLGDAAPNRVRPVSSRSGRCSASRRSTRKYSCSGSDVREDALGLGVAEPAQDAQRVLAERLLRAEQRDLVVERLAGERHEGRRDRERDAVGLDLEEDRRGDVPGGVAARLERGADAARRERAGVRLALHQVLAGELGDRLAVAGRRQERVVLLGRGAGHRHEPVRVVGRPVGQRPLLHAVGDGVDDGPIERLVPLDRPPQLLEDRLGEVLALGLLVEHVLAVDVGPGLLEVVLRLARRDGRRYRRSPRVERSMWSPARRPPGAPSRAERCAWRMKSRSNRRRSPAYQRRRLRRPSAERVQSCAFCTTRTASSSAKRRSGSARSQRPAPPAARPGRRPCCGGPRGASRPRSGWASQAPPAACRGARAGPRGRPTRIGSSSSRAWRDPVRQVADVAEQEIGRQPCGARDHGRRLGEQVGGLEGRPGGGLGRGRAPGSVNGRDTATVRPRNVGQPLGRREACGVVGRCRRDEPQLQALRAAAQHQPARRHQQPQLRAGLLAGGDVVGAVGRRPGWPASPPTAGRRPAAARRAGSRRGPGGRPRRRRAPARAGPRSGPRRSAPARWAARRRAARAGRPRRARRPGPGSRRAARPRPTAGPGSGRPRRPRTGRRPGRGRRSGRRAVPR